MELDIDSALKELQEKSYFEIEAATAKKWAARAIAAYVLSVQSNSAHDSLNYLIDGRQYESEALEHAAAAADFGNLAGELQSIIETSAFAAFRALVGDPGEESDEQTEEVPAEEPTTDPVQDPPKAE